MSKWFNCAIFVGVIRVILPVFDWEYSHEQPSFYPPSCNTCLLKIKPLTTKPVILKLPINPFEQHRAARARADLIAQHNHDFSSTFLLNSRVFWIIVTLTKCKVFQIRWHRVRTKTIKHKRENLYDKIINTRYFSVCLRWTRRKWST
jgi:hypothetical protein